MGINRITLSTPETTPVSTLQGAILSTEDKNTLAELRNPMNKGLLPLFRKLLEVSSTDNPYIEVKNHVKRLLLSEANALLAKHNLVDKRYNHPELQ